MTDETYRFRALPLLLTAASVVVIIAGLKAAKAIFAPFLLAILLAILGSIPMAWLLSRRVPRWLAVLSVSFLMMAVVFSVGLLMFRSVEQFVQASPEYRERLTFALEDISNRLNEFGIHTTKDSLISGGDAASAFDIFSMGLRNLVSTFSSTIMVTIMMVFMLFEASRFHTKLKASFKDGMDTSHLLQVIEGVQRYLGIKTVTSALTGIVIFFWVSIMGIKFAALWGVVGFLLNYIPVIGSIVASIPALLLTLSDFGLTHTLIVGTGYIAINNLISNVLEPVLMGNRLGLSPLVVFLSLVFWGWLWGPIGMLLSVPLTMVVRILLYYSREFRWASDLLEN